REHVNALCGSAASENAQRACLLQHQSNLGAACLNALKPAGARPAQNERSVHGFSRAQGGAPGPDGPAILPAAGSAAIPTVAPAQEAGGSYKRVVVLTDLHVEPRVPAAQSKVIKDISSWDDVALVAVTGDVCEKYGSAAELARAKQLLSKLGRSYCAVTGNHDYIYRDKPDKDGDKVKGSETERAAKLKAFQEALPPGRLYYIRQLGRYLLVFLSVDDLDSKHLTEISEAQLNWLTGTLQKNKAAPTIIFFHSPLKGTLTSGKNANTPGFVAQPEDKIRNILANNRQVVLWVSGHTHTSPTSPDFSSRANYYGGTAATNIHNSEVGGGHNWTNSLFLYKNKIVVKTYDHKAGDWLKAQRVFPVP
ncbi:MAG: hypothetical protein A3J79_08065, partial [Elusimicrobia bacterium RIFOXYB2_FULL_62_6]